MKTVPGLKIDLHMKRHLTSSFNFEKNLNKNLKFKNWKKMVLFSCLDDEGIEGIGYEIRSDKIKGRGVYATKGTNLL